MHRIAAYIVAALALTTLNMSTQAQSVPWVEFLDDESGEICAIVNTSNAELVVLEDTGELVIVTGTDLILVDTFVDDSLFVFVGGFPAGLLDYANDAFGFPKLWWLGLDGTVVETDPLTGEPSSSGAFPDEIEGALCGACERWDDQVDCDEVFFVDEDADGVDDAIDFCSDTPLDEIPDGDGCSCSQLDGDGDFVSDCDDACPETSLDEDVDFDGCGCSEFDEDGDGVEDCFDDCPGTDPFDDVDFDGCTDEDIIVVDPIDVPIVISCGNFTALTMMSMFAGLCSMRLARRRSPSPIDPRPEV